MFSGENERQACVVTIQDIIEMPCKSSLNLASSLADILNFADFACDTIYKVGTDTRDILHCCESLLGVGAQDMSCFV